MDGTPAASQRAAPTVENAERDDGLYNTASTPRASNARTDFAPAAARIRSERAPDNSSSSQRGRGRSEELKRLTSEWVALARERLHGPQAAAERCPIDDRSQAVFDELQHKAADLERIIETEQVADIARSRPVPGVPSRAVDHRCRLHDVAFPLHGAARALRRPAMAGRQHGRDGHPVAAAIADSDALVPHDAQVIGYRIVQQAVTNAARHSDADTRVTLGVPVPRQEAT